MIGSFRKHVQKYAEFVFVTAPHDVEQSQDEKKSIFDSESSNDSEEDLKTEVKIEKSWWFNCPTQSQTFRGTNKNGPAIGFDDSLHLVEEAWQSLGPFHGILGFSQGACFVGLICNLAERGSK